MSRGGFAYGVAVGLVLGFACAALLGAADELFDGDDADPVAEAREVIGENYFEAVDADALDQASIRGMVGELRRRYDDRFSHYFGPEQLDEFVEATSGKFEGVGLNVNEVPRGLRVATVFPGSPADRAGIRVGELITAVDGRSIAGLPAEVSTGRIKGPRGTKVRLRVVPPDRGGSGGDGRELTLERAEVRIPAVAGRIVRTDGGTKVARLNFWSFSQGSHGELRDTVERLYRRGAEGLVLDLRGNGGGLLNEAILAASVFVEDGVVVSTESRTQGDRDYDAVGEALDPRPTVVLANRDTASAAEILIAALSTYDLATVVGTRTFGKGTFQEVIHLGAGGALDLTIGQYLTADGTSLADDGFRPDVRAEDDPKTVRRDEALDRALAVLAGEL
jgi:carboxyl-terminal processing protease